MLISRSPFGETFRRDINEEQERARLGEYIARGAGRKTVVVQGLGFVGTAMAAAASSASDGAGKPLYNVIGVDLPDERNYWKIARAASGLAPVVSADASLDAAYRAAQERGNLTATFSPEAYKLADVVVVDIHLDIRKTDPNAPERYEFTFEGYKNALRDVAENLREGALVIIETTVPPGATERLVKPFFEEIWRERGLDVSKLLLAHSYERVMPGKEYLSSITNFYRVYSGVNEASKAAAREFLESFINTKDFPLTELHSTTASEMSKVLENSFRAANIAFIQEWTEFAEAAGVNLFDVIQAIRVRPTHRNIMAPGLGVGGYCLTKDSLLADWANANLFGSGERLNVSLNAVRINDAMPRRAFESLRRAFGSLRGRAVTILGVSYLNDVADTRYSPTELLYDLCEQDGARLQLHDPMVSYWAEKDARVETSLEALSKMRHDIAIFAVRHGDYLSLSAAEIRALLPGVRAVVDTMNIISDATAKELSEFGIAALGVGKGHWNYAA